MISSIKKNKQGRGIEHAMLLFLRGRLGKASLRKEVEVTWVK